MRIIINFKNSKKLKYKQNQLSALIYRIIKNAGYAHIHNLPQKYPRFFSFSQLFLTANNHLSIIFSSPIKNLVLRFKDFLKKDKLLFLNKIPLTVESVKIVNYRLKYPVIIKTETPIIIRVPKEKYELYRINLDKNYKYFYWRPIEDKNIPLEPFIKQLEARIYKNYKLFTGREIKEVPVFIKYVYKKTVDFPYFKNGRKISQPGTLWEFEINPEISYNLVKFILDTGLGELTSQGYGFVNVKGKL